MRALRPSALGLLALTGVARPAWAEPEWRLAPGPAELTGVQAELASRLLLAESVGVAVARLQGAFANLPGGGSPCADPPRAEALARFRHFADRWHDSVQRVSVQTARLREVRAAPTVAPIVDEERGEVLDQLEARARRLEREWLELVAWVGHTAPRACKGAGGAPLELHAFAGVDEPAVLAAGERPAPLAVTATHGFVCTPSGPPVEPGGDLVLLTGRACWSADVGCGCTPALVFPGAVLGPEPPAPEVAAAVPTEDAPPAEALEEAGPGEPVGDAAPAPPAPR